MSDNAGQEAYHFYYNPGETPETYKCNNCRVTGVKLWREYSSCQKLLCGPCACHNEDKFESFLDNMIGDQIGYWIPAVPLPDIKNGFWAYFSVPKTGVKWWNELPLRKANNE